MGRPDKKTAGLNAFNEALRKLEGAPEPVPELAPGDRMPDGSIYLGVYRHKKLSAVFNVFAAPESFFSDKRFSAAISWSKLEHHAFMPDWVPMRCRPVRFEPRTDVKP